MLTAMSDAPVAQPSARLLSCSINGQPVQVAVEPHRTLLEVLRYQLDLIGSKQGCDKGDCGACTVQVDGQPRLACITLALMMEGREITTVEGLAADFGGCHPLQDAFDRWDAAQCGFCTPGILMSADALLRRVKGEVSPQQVRDALAGNLCRCTGYTKIIDAVVDASRVMADGDEGDATAEAAQ
jgi:aerobic-type carbon monoxide dehydrogenase small subunit (CoxS/CutS family)